MKTTIRYISGIPGIGKTEWAIQEMKKTLKEGGPIVVYASPTKLLLNEVYTRLSKECPECLDKIRRIYGNHVPNGEVVSSIESVLKGSRTRSGLKRKVASTGSVLLITHQGFVSVPHFPSSTELRVIFDESRKCIAQNRVLKFDTRDQLKILEKCIEIERHDDDHSFVTVTSDENSWKKFLKLAKASDITFTTKQRTAINGLLSLSRNPRVEVYLKFRKSTDSEKSSLTTFEVVLPSRVFEGFKEVTLLSAFFEDSQMFHLLRRNSKLVDITTQIPDYAKRRSALINRYKSVTLVPLTMQETALSISNQSNIMVDRLRTDIVDELKSSGMSTSKHLQKLRLQYLNPKEYDISREYVEPLRIVSRNAEHVEMDPMKWQVRQSLTVIDKWSDLKNTDSVGQPLLVLNKKTLDLIPEELLKRFETISTSVFGLNRYANRNVIVFLAAVNPTPELIQLYRILLEDYEFEKDHVADVCVQCVCRVSVRDVNSKDNVLVVLPDKKITSLLYERMSEEPDRPSSLRPKREMVFVDKNFELNVLGKKKFKEVSDTRKRVSNDERSKSWVNRSQRNKKLKLIATNISKVKSKLKNDPESKKYKSKLKSLLDDRENVKKEKNVN